MAHLRTLKQTITGRPAVDGAGVHLVRVFGFHDTEAFDPFLLLDAFDATDPNLYTKGFPWHPHRGIETVTYLIEGDIAHGDSLGNSGSILSGDCQWMTAGSGIIHQEMPKASPRMLGAQLWLNLPAKDKMCPPAYGDIKSEKVPLMVDGDGVEVRVVAGPYKGYDGAFTGRYVPAVYLDVLMPPQTTWHFEAPPTATVFTYHFYGQASFAGDDKIHSPKQAFLFSEGTDLVIKSHDEALRFIMLCAEPLNEPIAWGGPIVMNTKAELNLAFEELDRGTFIKK